MKHRFADLTAFHLDPLAFFLSRGCAAQEPLVPLFMGSQAVFLVTAPEMIRPIMKASEKAIKKGSFINKLEETIWKSSMTPSGEQHQTRRVALHRELARSIASSYVDQIASLTRRQAGALAYGDVFDAHQVTSRLTLRVICNLLLGPDVLTQAEENILLDLIELVEDNLATDIFNIPSCWPWVREQNPARTRYRHEMMMFVVERARKRAGESCVFKILEQLDLSAEQLGDEVLLLLANHHMTGAAAAWLLHHLACDPMTARLIAEEAVAVSDSTGELVPERLPQASLSLAFIREVLRLYPSTWCLSREVMQPIEFCGRKLKSGTILLISPWHMHRDPRFWDDPMMFRLDRRFASPAYLPFGIGPRACIGMNVSMLELQVLALEFAAACDLQSMNTNVGSPKPSITLVPPSLKLSIRPRACKISAPERSLGSKPNQHIEHHELS